MIDPVIAGMPPDAWLMLFLVCAIIAGVGALALRRLQQRRRDSARPQFPRSVAALIIGPVFGLFLGTISHLVAPDDWAPIDLREQFATIMTFTTGVGCLVAVVVLIIVDLPRNDRPNREVDSNSFTTGDHD